VEKADVLAHVMMIVQRTVQILVLIYVKAQQNLLVAVDLRLVEARVLVLVYSPALQVVRMNVQLVAIQAVEKVAIQVVVISAVVLVQTGHRNKKNSPSLTRGASFFISFDIHKRLQCRDFTWSKICISQIF
jgi:hypothetical protein